jgi:hypothetical protein
MSLGFAGVNMFECLLAKCLQIPARKELLCPNHRADDVLDELMDEGLECDYALNVADLAGVVGTR